MFGKIVSLFSLTAIVLLFSGIGHETQAQNTAFELVSPPVKIGTRLNRAADSYLEIKDALTRDDGEAASAAAGDFLQAVSQVDARKLTKSQKEDWERNAAVLTENAGKIKEAGELDSQRKAFFALSEAFGQTAEKFGPLSVTLYRQYCPMALGEGARWFSDSKEIRNPYLGAKMLQCGEVTGRIGKTN